MTSRLLFCFLLAAASVASGCKRKQPEAVAQASGSGVSAPDRLSPRETLPGRQVVFGLEVPTGMRVSSRFDDVVHLDGSRSVSDLVTYFSKRVSVANVELLSGGARFAQAHVKGDASRRVYRIEITQRGPSSHVAIRDITPPPAIQGLSEAERWQRAGMNPDGTLRNRLQQF